LRIRLYTLAKELGVANKDLVARCKEMGLAVKSHSSTISEEEAARVRAAYGKPPAPAPPQAPPEAPPKAPPKEPAPEPEPTPKAEAPPKPKAEPKPPEPEEPRRGAEIIGRIELPKEERYVREYGPRVRVKERRRPRGAERRRTRQLTGRRPATTRPTRAGPLIAERPSKITVEFPVTVRSLSQASGIRIDEIMRKLLAKGLMIRVNDPLGEDVVAMLASELGVEVEIKRERDLEAELAELVATPDKPEDLQPRAPVVALLGHVDHGKTSLLDAIRQTKVAAGEAGGITQHIGAYVVEHDGHKVVFLDTPGHEAFTAMRARGAQVTDIVVLVVAADDGVMPQTEEAINHARAAGVDIVVAINKCDLPAANPQRVMQQLAERDLLPAKWGGQVEVVEVSALTRQGLDDLVETLALQAEILELKANPNKPARGVVLEAALSEGRGAVATVLVQEGTLRKGDVFICGQAYGRVRSLRDHRGEELPQAGPSTPVEVSGLSCVPEAGEKFIVLGDLDKAREIAEARQHAAREESIAEREHVTLENLFATLEAGEQKELRLILKADVHGSLEVVRKSVTDLSTQEVRVNVLHTAVGGINDSDVLLADASDAIVIGFNVVPDPSARALAEQKGVDIRLYNVIYHLTDEVRAALESRLEPERREQVVGHAEVRRVFRISRVGNIAGCYVTDGRISRDNLVRVIRDNVVVYSSRIASLRHLKDDVREVPTGMECGIKVADYNDIKEGDIIEAYEVVEIKRTL